MFRASAARPLVLAFMLATGLVATLSATHSWNGFHWARKSNPFTLKLGDNMNFSWHGYLNATSYHWSLSSILDTTVVAGTSADPVNCPPTSGRVEICAAAYGTTGWVGVAQVWLTTGNHIVQGVVKMNETYFHTPQYNTPAWRHLVMCQEVGHTLGLDHQDENFNDPNLGTCMDYTNDPDGTIFGQLDNQSPNAHDYEQLEIIYAHVDGFTTVGNLKAADALPTAMRQIAFTGRGQWGKLVKSRANGKHAIYELDFGNGNKLLTFVIYA